MYKALLILGIIIPITAITLLWSWTDVVIQFLQVLAFGTLLSSAVAITSGLKTRWQKKRKG